MLYDELIDAEDKHVNLLVSAFKMLDKVEFKDDMESFFESLRAMNKIESFDINDEDGNRLYCTESSDSHDQTVLIYKEAGKRNNGVVFIFNNKRLLSLKCTIEEPTDSVYWVLYFTKSKVIQSNEIESNFKYSNLKDYILQYDVVCPLANYFLEYGDRV